MIALIATSLVKTLTSYLFGNYLKAHYGSVELDGAPSWYGQQPDEAICVSTFRDGGLENLELTKTDAEIKLRKRVSGIIDLVIYKNFQNLQSDEEAFLDRIKKDKKLPLFVKANTKFQNIKLDKDENKVFVRSCLDKNALIKYEQKRVKELSRDITYYKADKVFDELDDGSTKGSGRIKDSFDELDEIK